MNYLMLLIVMLKNIISLLNLIGGTDTDFRIKDMRTSTNPLFTTHDGNISTTAGTGSVQLTTCH